MSQVETKCLYIFVSDFGLRVDLIVMTAGFCLCQCDCLVWQMGMLSTVFLCFISAGQLLLPFL